MAAQRTRVIAFAAGLMLAATACSGPQPVGERPSPSAGSQAVKLEIGVTRGITPIPVGDEVHLVYEAVLFNLAPRDLDLDAVTVLAPGQDQPLLVLEGAALAQNTVVWDAEGAAIEGFALPPGGRAAVAIWLTVAEDRVPPVLEHRFRVRGTTGDGVRIGLELEGPRVFTDPALRDAAGGA